MTQEERTNSSTRPIKSGTSALSFPYLFSPHSCNSNPSSISLPPNFSTCHSRRRRAPYQALNFPTFLKNCNKIRCLHSFKQSRSSQNCLTVNLYHRKNPKTRLPRHSTLSFSPQSSFLRYSHVTSAHFSDTRFGL